MRMLVGLVTMLLLLAGPAFAASYDCSKATGADEVAVCKDGTLSSLDSEMAGLFFAYDKVPMLMGSNGDRQDEADAFLASRKACGPDLTCLRRVYTARIAALKQGLEGSMQQYSDLQNNVPPVTTPLPEAVETLIAAYGGQCERLGGKLVTTANHPAILSGDLDGDKIADYVINTQPMACTNSATAFCANAGCQVQIVVSSDRFADPINALGATPTLIQNETGTIARLSVDRTNCPTAAPGDACWATYSWKDGKSTISYAAEPTPAM